MGDWGVGLYQDDTAADLRNTIGLLAKLPVNGERLIEILIEHHGEPVSLDDDGGPTFWLVVADQFERRGIACPSAIKRALAAIDTNADLRDLERRGADPSDLKKRSKMLTVLGQRLRSPRPTRPRPKATRPPAFGVEVGEGFAFPTMNGRGFNPWARNSQQAGFVPNGWGAMLIIARGRVFDWLPWCATSSLTVDPAREPTLDDVLTAKLFAHAGLNSDHRATLCVPRRSHLRKMEMRSIGRLELDARAAARVITREHSPEYAVFCGWSFHVTGWNPKYGSGVAVHELL